MKITTTNKVLKFNRNCKSSRLIKSIDEIDPNNIKGIFVGADIKC